MIVHCPSCNTNYRHDPTNIAVATLAECARCDARFPLRGSEKSYRRVTPMEQPPKARVAGATADSIGADRFATDPAGPRQGLQPTDARTGTAALDGPDADLVRADK